MLNLTVIFMMFLTEYLGNAQKRKKPACSRLSTFFLEALACANIAVEAFCSVAIFNNIKLEEIEFSQPDL